MAQRSRRRTMNKGRSMKRSQGQGRRMRGGEETFGLTTTTNK